jgi:PAS domain S-box-containing protein
MKMPPQPSAEQRLRAENAGLHVRLEAAEEMLRAIRSGEVDALVVEGEAGPQIFTLQGLDAEQNRFRGEMLAQVSDAVIAMDTEDRITLLNAAAERQYGIRATDALGRKLSEIYTGLWPSPADEANAQAALRECGEWRGELIHRTPDGRELHVEAVVSTLRGTDGEITGYVGSIRDISGRKDAERELRESEARLRSILSQSPAGILETDAAGRMKLVNDHWCHMLGYTEAEMLGKTVLDITHPSCIAATTEAVGRLAAGGPDFQIEKFYCRKDGTRLSAQSNVTALRSPTGEFLGLIAVVLDITDRLRIESELRDRTHFLERIAQVTPGVLQVFDLIEKRDVFINRTVESLLGYSPEEVHAMGAEVVRRLMHPDDLPGFEEHIARVRLLADGEVAAFEFRMRERAGGWRWFHSHDAVFARDAAGAVRQLIGVSTEITGRKLAEEVTARLAAIVESSHDALFSEDLDGIITSWNSGAEQIFGYRADQIMGTSILRLIPEARQDEEHELQRKLAAGERGGTFEATRIAKDGREFPTSITISPVKDAAGKVIGTSRVVRDITERQQVEAALRATEERMRLAAEATGVGIWEWNVLTNAIRWDAQMFRIYGVVPTADGFVNNETRRGAFLPEDLARQEEVLADTLHRLGKSTREFRILRADNRECRWIQAVETVRANEEGKAEWVVGTNLDVTARTNAENAIREEAQRKDEFLAMLGHELRNPLNAIRNAVQIGLEAPHDRDACQWAASVIDRQSQQLSRMVDDLLDVARINRGRIELRVAALDLGPVLEQAIAVVRPLLDRRRQTFTSDIGSQLRVNGDGPRLEQVFVNLLTNAVKYTPDNGRISLHARNEDGKVMVVIADNGAGISAELLPHIFDLFRQADSTLDRALGGLGIGLNVVKSLVEMHLGQVRVESAGMNAGTTATVSLPVLLEWPATESQPAAQVIATARPKPVRVLIVDDHIDAAESLETLLQRRGCEARRAHSGPAGVAAARDFRPEVLLLDLGLPGFDGYEVARILRAEAPFPDALFIAISGYAQDGDRQRCLASGFDDHFPKPLDLMKLLQVIHSRPDREPGTHGHFPPCAPVGGPP